MCVFAPMSAFGLGIAAERRWRDTDSALSLGGDEAVTEVLPTRMGTTPLSSAVARTEPFEVFEGSGRWRVDLG
jgi:hypothetical protein